MNCITISILFKQLYLSIIDISSILNVQCNDFLINSESCVIIPTIQFENISNIPKRSLMLVFN